MVSYMHLVNYFENNNIDTLPPIRLVYIEWVFTEPVQIRKSKRSPSVPSFFLFINCLIKCFSRTNGLTIDSRFISGFFDLLGRDPRVPGVFHDFIEIEITSIR